ncbi:hypothetical protein ACFU51_26640 [Streptomyces sp. NPDC057430]|uniref:hypothetical protein n=1 Tax=unclassified Streptomyces TaxID=2593676 RepID=UPI00367EB323
MNLADILLRTAAEHGSRAAVEHGSRTAVELGGSALTYAELDTASGRVAHCSPLVASTPATVSGSTLPNSLDGAAEGCHRQDPQEGDRLR